MFNMRIHSIYDFDVIVMAAGTNDWQDDAAMGDINSTDITQFYGALNVMMDWITEASQIRVEQNKNPIKVIFTDLYYADRVSGQYAKRNNRFITKNGKGYTLKDYQKAIDDIADKYAAYGMEIWQMLRFARVTAAPVSWYSRFLLLM